MEHETPSIHSPENNVDDNRRFLGVSSVAALIAMLAALIMVTGVTLTPIRTEPATTATTPAADTGRDDPAARVSSPDPAPVLDEVPAMVVASTAPGPFNDGSYTVGTDIQPGTYINAGATPCTFRIDTVFSDVAIIPTQTASRTSANQSVVTLTPNDIKFVSTGCGTWDPAISRTTFMTGEISDGDHLLGVDMAAGVWHTDGGPGCGWQRRNGYEESLLDNRIIAQGAATGPTDVEIPDTDFGFTTTGCGAWTATISNARAGRAFDEASTIQGGAAGHGVPLTAPASARTRTKGDGTALLDIDFADPFAVTDNGITYAFSTNSFFGNVPVVASGTGTQVTPMPDALPSSNLPAWTQPGSVWAPAVAKIGGRWVMWYTTRHTASGRQCISSASASNPAGPYVDTSAAPMICDLAGGGSIDPSPVKADDGSMWLIWKNDGNCCGMPTSIYSQKLSADGLTVVGSTANLITNSLAWEGDVVEGATMTFAGGQYQMLYSANHWDTTRYAIGHAVCASITGPCVKDPTPWLASNPSFDGPGGPEFVNDSANNWTGRVVYHAYNPGQAAATNPRLLREDSLTVDNGNLTRVESNIRS